MALRQAGKPVWISAGRPAQPEMASECRAHCSVGDKPVALCALPKWIL